MMRLVCVLLIHWGRVTHICVGKLSIIDSDNGLSPGRRQAIIWTKAGILWIGPLGTNCSEILIRIQTFSLKKIRFKMSSAKCCPFRQCVNSLALGRCESNFRLVIFRLIWVIDILSTSYKMPSGDREIPWDPSDNKLTLVQVMAWWRQTTSHYLTRLRQYSPRSLLPYSVIRPQWVNQKWCNVKMNTEAFVATCRCLSTCGAEQSGTKTNLVAKILATNFGVFFVI